MMYSNIMDVYIIPSLELNVKTELFLAWRKVLLFTDIENVFHFVTTFLRGWGATLGEPPSIKGNKSG